MIATGRRVVLGDFFREEDFFFLSWARRSWRRGNELNALEIRWGGGIHDLASVVKKGMQYVENRPHVNKAGSSV